MSACPFCDRSVRTPALAGKVLVTCEIPCVAGLVQVGSQTGQGIPQVFGLLFSRVHHRAHAGQDIALAVAVVKGHRKRLVRGRGFDQPRLPVGAVKAAVFGFVVSTGKQIRRP